MDENSGLTCSNHTTAKKKAKSNISLTSLKEGMPYKAVSSQESRF